MMVGCGGLSLSCSVRACWEILQKVNGKQAKVSRRSIQCAIRKPVEHYSEPHVHADECNALSYLVTVTRTSTRPRAGGRLIDRFRSKLEQNGCVHID